MKRSNSDFLMITLENIVDGKITNLEIDQNALFQYLDKIDMKEKYLKRVRNRQKLFERRKAKYGKKKK